VSRTTLDLIERELGPSRELLEFLTGLAATEAFSPVERRGARTSDTEGAP